MLVGCAIGIAGCAGTSIVMLDGGPREDGSAIPSTGRIVVEGESAIGLSPGAAATFRARWIGPDEQPVRAGAVSFGLEGTPRGSTLRAIAATTDDAGRVEGALIAGTMPGTFRVRIAAFGATPAHLDVAVGAEGFGAIVVEVRGGAARTVAARRASLMLDATCEEALARPEGDRVRELALGENAVEFVALPAGQVFTVVATASSREGVVVASGCLEAVEVRADRSIRAVVDLQPQPLIAAGEYASTIEAALGSIGSTATRRLASVAEASARAAGGSEALLLDALERELRDRGHDDVADALVLERASGEPDRVLRGLLETQSAGPARATLALLESIAPSLDRITIGGTLAIGSDTSGSTLGSFVRERVSLSGPGGEAIEIPMRFLPIDLARRPVLVRWTAGSDSLEMDELRVVLPLGELIVGAIDGLARARGAADPAALVMLGSGCGALDAVIESRPSLRDACDATCVLEICGKAAQAAFAPIEEAASALDAERRDVVLAGMLACEDTSGDLRVDAMLATGLAGAWRSVDGASSEPVSARFGATRIAAPAR